MLECNPSIIPMESKFNPVLEVKVSDKLNTQLIGSPMNAMLVTRPDICAAVYYLTRYQSNPNEIVWNQANVYYVT